MGGDGMDGPGCCVVCMGGGCGRVCACHPRTSPAIHSFIHPLHIHACFLPPREQLADKMTEAVTDAVLTIAEPGKPIDLHMVEVVHMTHKLGTDSRFVRGLVGALGVCFGRGRRAWV